MIFVDTSFFFALFADDERHHLRAVQAMEAYRGERTWDLFLTTNHVVFETVTLIRRRTGHALAASAAEWLSKAQLARIYRATAEDEAAALAYLVKHRDKEYSAVDCLSFVVMDKLEIREALTFDSDFSHRFIMLPGPK